ncbi:hypothetical protein AMTRI_Chr09g14830 [Amborella trichopoda]|uniref:Uncharacterized protein n=1 Tax=Amborella trichopoda TaxID=13333 RepID=W1NLX7_AMBTC|nr:hypothetical protein AMTR_s00001p00128110 [Amborella trichopoda]
MHNSAFQNSNLFPIHALPEAVLICPKPKRAAMAVPEFICNPLRRSFSGQDPSQNTPENVSGKASKGFPTSCPVVDSGFRAGDSGFPAIDFGFPATENASPINSKVYYCGSPPVRSDNPLVHDTLFLASQRLPMASGFRF